MENSSKKNPGNQSEPKTSVANIKGKVERTPKSKNSTEKNKEEVLLNLPAGMKYKLPGKQQRVILGSIVVGLNLLLLVAVILYFYNPDFQTYIYNVGR